MPAAGWRAPADCRRSRRAHPSNGPLPVPIATHHAHPPCPCPRPIPSPSSQVRPRTATGGTRSYTRIAGARAPGTDDGGGAPHGGAGGLAPQRRLTAEGRGVGVGKERGVGKGRARTGTAGASGHVDGIRSRDPTAVFTPRRCSFAGIRLSGLHNSDASSPDSCLYSRPCAF